jgi:hypothetical protein
MGDIGCPKNAEKFSYLQKKMLQTYKKLFKSLVLYIYSLI